MVLNQICFLCHWRAWCIKCSQLFAEPQNNMKTFPDWSLSGLPYSIPCCHEVSFSQAVVDCVVAYVVIGPPGLTWRNLQLLKCWKTIGAAVWADHDSALGSSAFTSTWVHKQASVFGNICITCSLKVMGSTSNSRQRGWTACLNKLSIIILPNNLLDTHSFETHWQKLRSLRKLMKSILGL